MQIQKTFLKFVISVLEDQIVQWKHTNREGIILGAVVGLLHTRKHLSWLIVCGNLFEAFLGLIAEIINFCLGHILLVSVKLQ